MKNLFVKAMPYVIKILRGRHERWITRTLIATGAIILVSALTENEWLDIVVSIYNDLFGRSVSPPDESKSYIVILIGVIVGGLLIALGIVFHLWTKNAIKSHPLVRIEHSSIQAVSFAKINKDLSEYDVESYLLDQKEELITIDRSNIYHAIREQEKLVERVSSRLNANSDTEMSYFGLAHIPLTVLFGYQLSDKLNCSFYEWNQNDLIWEAVESKPTITYPPLLLTKNDTVQSISNTKEIVFKVGVTYPIAEEEIKELQLHHLNSYYLHLNPPHRNAILCSEQLRSYKKTFRELLDQVNQRYPSLQTIHLFYSGQPSLAYTLGSAISLRMDAEIWIYNHVRTERPKYKWAIRLPSRYKPIDVIINSEG